MEKVTIPATKAVKDKDGKIIKKAQKERVVTRPKQEPGQVDYLKEGRVETYDLTTRKPLQDTMVDVTEIDKMVG